MALAIDASTVNRQATHGVHYLDALASMVALSDGTVEAAFKRWGGTELPLDLSLFGERLAPRYHR